MCGVRLCVPRRRRAIETGRGEYSSSSKRSLALETLGHTRDPPLLLHEHRSSSSSSSSRQQQLYRGWWKGRYVNARELSSAPYVTRRMGSSGRVAGRRGSAEVKGEEARKGSLTSTP